VFTLILASTHVQGNIFVQVFTET